MSCPTLKAWLTADGRGLVAAPRCPNWRQNQGQGRNLCVSASFWVGHISLHLPSNAHTHKYTHRAPAPSVFDMGELNDRGGKAKGKASTLFSSFFPPSLSLFTARSDINAPYVWTFSDWVWHAINKRSRHTHTSTPSVHCVIWHRGWNEHSQYNIYSTSRTHGNEISSVCSRADVDLHL